MGICVYCEEQTKGNKKYCCKLHKIYQNKNEDEIYNLTPQEIVDNIISCDLTAVNSNQFMTLLDIFKDDTKALENFISNPVVSNLYVTEIIYLFNNILSTSQAETFAKTILKYISKRQISSFKTTSLNDCHEVTKNEEQFEHIILTLKLLDNY